MKLVEIGGRTPDGLAIVHLEATDDELRALGALLFEEVRLTRPPAVEDPFDAVRTEHPHVTQTSIGLVRHLITRAFYGSRRRARWSHVGAMIGHGSGVSQALCRACSVDPDEMLGYDAADEEEGDEEEGDDVPF